MSITDELREFARRWPSTDYVCKDMLAIADRIDAEHEEAIQQVLMNEGGVPATDENMAESGWVRKDKEHIISHATIEVTPHIDWSRMADELNEFVGHSSTRTNGLKLRRTQMQFTDEQQRFIDEHYQLLPVDADGEPIHIGDVMENIVCPSVHREVSGVGVECFYGWDDGNGRYSQFSANCYRHHHEPTVEDVLTKFGIDWEYETNSEDRAALLAEYAAKLRLAKGEDAR